MSYYPKNNAYLYKDEAIAFLQVGWSISRMPIKRKPTAFELVGECLF